MSKYYFKKKLSLNRIKELQEKIKKENTIEREREN